MTPETMTAPLPQTFSASRSFVRFLEANSRQLAELDAAYRWSLNAAELAAIQGHFRSLRREPTRAELETLAQTWSEHCKHKTFTGPIRYREGKKTRLIKNLLQETIAAATKELNKPWCLSVFKDNAGIVSLRKGWALAVKVETHNHPCAVEPYGGAETGLGGVIRDVLGAGLGAKPVLGTDVFCVGPLDWSKELPAGALHPKRTLREVVAGVRDYGNRMGIPTAAGGIWFDEGYRLNPLVFVGSVGVIPESAVKKEVRPGDLIVAVGGRTGRDGLKGATFSSAALKDQDTSAVQIGHAINEKVLLDALLLARERRLYRAVTDCGAGGFSSAIGELAAGKGKGGARVDLDKAKLKDAAVEPWEIWLSESQERMILAVPPKNLKALGEVFDSQSCEWAVLGEFTGTGVLEVLCAGQPLVSLSLDFLHGGLPRVERQAVWDAPAKAVNGKPCARPLSLSQALRAALAHPNVCSREWVIRQYDHEVQAGTVLKPLQGARHDGPGDACVIWPQAATGDMANFSGFAVSHGLNPSYGKLDPYRMALACVDEALRNLACAGADVTRASLLDNFCWGSPDDPQALGALVRAALGAYDAAKGFGAPFISGKDSLYNQSKDADGKVLSVPGTLLITAVAPVADVRRAVSMEFKAPGNALYLVGSTLDELGGSLYAQLTGRPGGTVPEVKPKAAAAAFKAAHAAVCKKLVQSAHDLSEGGLVVAAAEMAFSGEFGALIDLDEVNRASSIVSEDVLLFSESQSRILLEVAPKDEAAFLRCFKGVAVSRVGDTLANPVLKVKGLDGTVIMEEPIEELKAAWQKTLPEAL